MWGRSDNTIEQAVGGLNYEGDFDTERWLIEATLSGNIEFSDFTLTPDVQFIYLREEQGGYSVENNSSYVHVNGNDLDLGQLSSGLKVSYHTSWDGASLQPFVGGRLFWNFDNPDQLLVDGSVISTNDLRAAVSLGVDMQSKSTLFGVEATYDGLFTDELSSFGVKLSFSHSF